MNVALTRCRKGLVVVTNKAFLQRLGRNTLLGQLCTAWSSPSSHRNDVWIDWKDMLSPGLPVDLPGLQATIRTRPAKQELLQSSPPTGSTLNTAAPEFSLTFPSLSPSPLPSPSPSTSMSTWATRTAGAGAGKAGRGYNSKDKDKDLPPLSGPQAIRTRTRADLHSHYHTQNRGAQRTHQGQTQLGGMLGTRRPLVMVNEPFPALGGEVKRTLSERLALLNI